MYFVLFLSLTISDGLFQPSAFDSIQIEIYDCNNSMFFHIDDNELYYNAYFRIFTQTDTTILMEPRDAEIIQNFCYDFLKSHKKREIFWNECENQNQFHYLLIIRTSEGKPLKRVLIGNYYDERFNTVTRIINNYLREVQFLYDYSDEFRKIASQELPRLVNIYDKKEIERMIKSQADCDSQLTPFFKKIYLNDTCEF